MLFSIPGQLNHHWNYLYVTVSDTPLHISQCHQLIGTVLLTISLPTIVHNSTLYYDDKAMSMCTFVSFSSISNI